MKAILICGKARSGKNQLADYLKEALDLDWEGNPLDRTLIRGNAQTVKERATDQYNWNGEKDAEGRQLLIDITNRGYDTDTYYWERETFNSYLVHTLTNKNCKYLIVPDWRYASTKDYFEKTMDEVITIRITRVDQEVGTHDNHSSEMDYLNFDVDVEVTNTTLENLKEVAKEIVQRCCD